MDIKTVEDHVRLLLDGADRPPVGRLVNYQKLSSTHAKVKSYPLSELSSADNRRVQEALVVYDLLNVLVGSEGVYIRFSNMYDPYNDIIPEFKIAKAMDPSLKSFSKRIAKLGKYYMVLNRVAEKWSSLKYGTVLQRLGYEVKSFLRLNYLQFIVEKLEKNFKINENFSVREMEQMLNDFDISKNMELLFTLYKRIAQEDELRQNMDKMEEDFRNFMDDLKKQGDSQNGTILATDTSILPITKGGVILGIVQDLIHDNLGDRSNVSFLKNLFNKIAENYFGILRDWLTQGALNDPFDEFMIVDTMKHVNSIQSLLKYGDRVWDTQYVVRKDGLLKQFSDQSNSNDLLFRILITGKLLNVLRISLDLNELPINMEIDNNNHISSFTELLDGNNLELFVNKWYDRANTLCSKLYLEGYQLEVFLQDLQKYFFGKKNANGLTDFLSQNMTELTKRYRPNGMDKVKLQKNFELQKKVNYSQNDVISQLLFLQLEGQSFEETIMPYVNQENDEFPDDEQNMREKSISNAETETTDLLKAKNFQTLKDILLREVRSSEPTSALTDNTPHPGTVTNQSNRQHKSNIHYLSFEIMIPYPLNIIITRTCVVQFQIISRYIYFLQYYSELLEDTWMDINKHRVWKYRGYSPLVRQKIIKKSRVIHNKMNQFIKLVLEYFVQDVVEKEMRIDTTEAPNTYDWQTGLQERLTNIMTNCCLSQLVEIQLQIFEIIHKFCKFLTSMRRELCQIDYNLYQLIVARTSTSEGDSSPGLLPDTQSHFNKIRPFNEEDSIKMIPDLIKYIELVGQGFEQHTIAFKEGLTHYRHNHRTTSAANNLGAHVAAEEYRSTRLLSSLNL